MRDELAVKRFYNNAAARSANPIDAIKTALAEFEQNGATSVIVICVSDDGLHSTYFAGPYVGSFRKLWTTLQFELLRVVERMTSE